MPRLTYDYKPKLWIMLLVIVFFGACAVIIGQMALTNDRGLTINRIFNFSQSNATLVYWLLCLVSLGFVALGLIGVIKSFGQPKQIILDGDVFHAPKTAISKVVISIPYNEIVDIIDQKVQKQVFLVVQGQRAKVTISRSALSSKAEFQQMREALIARVSALHS